MSTAAVTTEIPLALRATHRREPSDPGFRLARYLPRGNMLDEGTWQQRHKILQVFLALHVPALALFGLYMDASWTMLAFTLAPMVLCLGLGDLTRKHRAVASFFTTAGIVYAATALVVLAHGAIEAHFHFFIIIGFIALYQDWVPFLWNIVFVVLSHGVGSLFRSDLMFSHHAGMTDPWLWSLIHGVAVLLACVGMVLFWRVSEDEQEKTLALTAELGETARRQFTSELLVNLARRNQSMLYRQLEIIAQLEQNESDPDALAELFRLDHLATRIRRNAESLLVLAGDSPTRVWSRPVKLTDVVRASIAETEDLSRVVFLVDDRLAVLGHAVTDLTHLLAELIDNAVRSSPPNSRVTVRSTPDVRVPGTTVVTVEDWGVGMPPGELATANQTLHSPGDVDTTVSKSLGLHVVARLASRYDVDVSLTSTSGGITAVVVLPPELFFSGRTGPEADGIPSPTAGPEGRADRSGLSDRSLARELRPEVVDVRDDVMDLSRRWGGWWASEEGQRAVRVLSDGPAPEVWTQPNAQPSVLAPALAPVPAAAPAPSSNPAVTPSTAPPTPPAGNGTPLLSRRTPQANLAPELRRADGESTPASPERSPAAAPDAAQAREALSRYQASRRAALAEHDSGRPST